VLSPAGQPLAVPMSAEVAPGPGGMMVPVAPAGSAMASIAPIPEVPEAPPPPPRLPTWMADAKQQGAAQAATLKTVGTLVQDNPKQAATIVRDWLTSVA
jgi:flagellar M-ring protein FliF